ncbi:SDR family NAD(P)-dependent oxidoreductase, partial [Pseudomonas ogarae]|uniref:SDR family NAD(P)-dependent oxidoreductase n=2 Tax=Pseudomonas TaxID=286 RepID=UPI00194EBC19
MNYLDQKVVVITGASSGLGAASARALAACGVRIVAAAIDGPGLNAFVADLRASGVDAVGKVTDVTDLDESRALARF